ncbi:MAG: hypothetical protein ACLGG0_04470 [Bacteriovoracia bacterium]
MIKLLGVAVVASLLSTATHARLETRSLGTVTVSDLQSAPSLRDFRDLCNVVGIKAVMKKDKADIRNITVNFADRNAAQRFYVGQTLRQGEMTQEFDLRGHVRCIDNIIVEASSRGSFWKSSTIELIATLDLDFRRPVPGPGPRPFPGNDRLTQADGIRVVYLSDIFVDEDGGRHSNPPFARPVCNVDAIMLQSLGDGTYINRVTVMYADGSLDDVRAPGHLAQRSETGWLRLDNDTFGRREKCIRNIQIQGRSEVGGRRDRPSSIKVLGLSDRNGGRDDRWGRDDGRPGRRW